MLIRSRKLQEVSFGKLMEVYVEGCLERGQDLFPEETEARQIAIGEQEFYNYLNQVFFRTPGSLYAVWEEQGKYISALRLEPFQDGLLLEALEPRPDRRQKGFAKKLITAVMAQANATRIYSHVHKHNVASLRTHESCGFHVSMDYALCVDGSVRRDMVTMCFEKGDTP